MKKVFFGTLITLFSISLFAQEHPLQYKIQSVTYFMDGSTTEYSLRTEVKIDFEQIFYSEESLLRYIKDYNIKLENLRQLETVTVRTVYLDPQNNIVPVVLLVTTKDTWNLFALPYPRYDSNTGLNLRIKLKDYNFVGSLRTLNAEIGYEFNEKNEHLIAGALSFDLPFGIKNIEASWNNSIGLSYAVGKDFRPNISTGLSFSQPLGPHSIDFGFTQGFNYDPKEYPDDGPYFSESVYINFPIQLAYIENWGKVRFIPGLSFAYNWSSNVFFGKEADMQHEDLKGPSASISYAIATSRVNWIGNFRDGASFSFNQQVGYNFGKTNLSFLTTFEAMYFKAFKYGAVVSRLSSFTYLNDTREIGTYMRGVRDKGTKTEGAFILNLDFPIKLFSTDWQKFNKSKIVDYLNFEMQAVPFIDLAATLNNGILSTGGLEVLIYPKKMRSIVGRVSIGFNFLPWKGFTQTLKDFELFFGIGLFY